MINKAFEKFFNEKLEGTGTLYSEYKGISKKEYPKWKGWKVINSYKAKGIRVAEIRDEELDTLVENFYFVMFLKENLE